MRVIPSSPRVRRRFFRLGIVLAVAGTVAAIMALVHGGKQPSAAPPKNAPPAQLVKQSRYVSPSDRRAINKTLDQFIPAALDRTATATAWRLSGPNLKGGTTLRQWRHGTSPIPYFPARGNTFHGWTVIDAGPNSVDFSLLVHPQRGSQTSSWVFQGEMIKRHGRWLVNGLYTAAIMVRPDKHGRHEVGPADFAAGAGAASQSGQGGAPPPGDSAKLGKTWLIILVAGLALALLFPLGFGTASALRSRRSRMRYLRSEPRTMPPLPRPTQGTSESAGGGGIGAQRH
jgi:hypothetical protein